MNKHPVITKKTNKQLILNDYIIPQKHSKLFEKKRLFA